MAFAREAKNAIKITVPVSGRMWPSGRQLNQDGNAQTMCTTVALQAQRGTLGIHTTGLPTQHTASLVRAHGLVAA